MANWIWEENESKKNNIWMILIGRKASHMAQKPKTK